MLDHTNPKSVNTSYVEKHNLTMCMHMSRFTRLTNAFRKKIENHRYVIALHFVYYNLENILKSLSVTPEMQAGLTKRILSIEDMLTLHRLKLPKKDITIKRKMSNFLYTIL